MALSTRSSAMPRARSWESTMRWRMMENPAVSAEVLIVRQLSSGSYRQAVIVRQLSSGSHRQAVSADRESGPENTLFSAVAHAHVEADYAVLIAVAHDRDVAVDVVFALDDLLRTLRDVGAVAERDVIGELLFDGDLGTFRRGVGFRGQALRIDLDAADAEE